MGIGPALQHRQRLTKKPSLHVVHRRTEQNAQNPPLWLKSIPSAEKDATCYVPLDDCGRHNKFWWTHRRRSRWERGFYMHNALNPLPKEVSCNANCNWKIPVLRKKILFYVKRARHTLQRRLNGRMTCTVLSICRLTTEKKAGSCEFEGTEAVVKEGRTSQMERNAYSLVPTGPSTYKKVLERRPLYALAGTRLYKMRRDV